MPQGFDGIETGGLAGREIAEDDTYGGGKSNGRDHDAKLEDKRDAKEAGTGSCSREAHNNPAQPAKG